MARTAAVPARRAPAARPGYASRPGHHVAPKGLPAPALPRGAAVLDALLRGGAWIAIVFLLLAGIVFFNVDLLRMNREIAATADRTAAVKRENARLRTDLARLGSSERIQRVAAERGLLLPAPGEVRYLRSRPAADARRAAERIEAGEAAARANDEIAGTPAAPATGTPAAQPDAPQAQLGAPVAQLPE